MSKAESMDDENAGGSSGGSSKLFIPMMLLAVTNVAGTGFVAMKVMKPVTVQVQAEAGGGHGESSTGPVVPLDPFVVNLNEPGTTRFLKATFELELTSPHALEEFEKTKRVVRDEVLRYLSGLAYQDTLGEDGKARIRDEVTFRVDKSLGGGRVKRTFFTEFVVQ